MLAWAEPHLIPVPSSALGDPLPITCYVNEGSQVPFLGLKLPVCVRSGLGQLISQGYFNPKILFLFL